MATDPNSSSKSKPLDGFSESGDMYWGMITNQAKALRNPNPEALREHLAEVLEEPNDIDIDSEQSAGLFTTKDVAVMASAGMAIQQTAGATGSVASSGGSSGSTGTSGTSGSGSGSGDSEEDGNSALAGITKYSAHPINPAAAATGAPIPSGPPLTGEKLRIAKFEILSKLSDLQNRGVALSQEYNMNSDYDVMQREYNIHLSIRNKQIIVSMYDQGFTGAVNVTEFVNETYNPFNFKLKGVSKAINSEREVYRDIWGDFYEMYHKDAKMIHPVLRLGFALGNTLTNHHIMNSRSDAEEAEKARTNKYIEEQIKLHLASITTANAAVAATSVAGRPTYDDLIRQNTDLERKVAYLNSNTSKILEQMATHDRKMQQASMVQRPTHTQTAQHSPSLTAIPALRYPVTQDSRRLDDHLGRMSMNDSRSRHSALMREQDRIIKGGSGHHRRGQESTISDASETDEGTETDSPVEERRSSGHKSNKSNKNKGRVSSSSSSESESRSSRSSARSTTTGNSRASKGGKRRAIKIDTEQLR